MGWLQVTKQEEKVTTSVLNKLCFQQIFHNLLHDYGYAIGNISSFKTDPEKFKTNFWMYSQI